MVPVYAIALFAGFLMLLAWIVAGVVGFGMAGMSASFGGWPPVLAALGALAGAVAMVAVARVFGPDTA